jgi:hypothetical protein
MNSPKDDPLECLIPADFEAFYKDLPGKISIDAGFVHQVAYREKAKQLFVEYANASVHLYGNVDRKGFEEFLGLAKSGKVRFLDTQVPRSLPKSQASYTKNILRDEITASRCVALRKIALERLIVYARDHSDYPHMHLFSR